jgi:hypothetical protein
MSKPSRAEPSSSIGLLHQPVGQSFMWADDLLVPDAVIFHRNRSSSRQ